MQKSKGTRESKTLLMTWDAQGSACGNSTGITPPTLFYTALLHAIFPLVLYLLASLEIFILLATKVLELAVKKRTPRAIASRHTMPDELVIKPFRSRWYDLSTTTTIRVDIKTKFSRAYTHDFLP